MQGGTGGEAGVEGMAEDATDAGGGCRPAGLRTAAPPLLPVSPARAPRPAAPVLRRVLLASGVLVRLQPWLNMWWKR